MSQGTVFYGLPENESVSLSLGGTPSSSMHKLVDLFKDFLIQHTDQGEENGIFGGTEGTFKYQNMIQGLLAENSFGVEVDLEDIYSNQEVCFLGDLLREKPLIYIPQLEYSLDSMFRDHAALLKEKEGEWPAAHKGLARAQLQLVSYEKPLGILDLKSDDIEKFVTITGIITRAAKVKHQARKMMLECRNCKDQREWEMKLGASSNLIPRTCQSARDNTQTGEIEACPPDPYQIIGDSCVFWDVQDCKLQELPEKVPVGEMPRHINIVLSRDLCDKVMPGSLVTVCGIYSTASIEKSTGAKKEVSVKSSYIHVLSFAENRTEGVPQGLSFTNEEKMIRLSKRPNIRAKIYEAIAPSIASGLGGDCLTDIKQGVACLLFGGSPKVLPDGTRLRGDINILLMGDPGTAKSQFLKFVDQCAPLAIYTSGKGSSAAGLTASVVRDSHGSFFVEGGAMVLADGGVVCIDEFDKMRIEDQVAIHEAMEQQTISIAKAGITTTLNTRCSVLAAANPTFGAYDDLMETSAQIEFASTILSRFDMLFLVRDIRSNIRDRSLAEHVINLHAGIQTDRNPEKDGVMAQDELISYINYARKKCFPRVCPEAATRLQNVYVESRRKVAVEKSQGRDVSVPITVRQLEALVRISEALAKMELCENATEEHVAEAVRLFTLSTLDAANHRGSINERMTDEMREQVRNAENSIRRFLAIGSKAQVNSLQRQLEQVGVSTAAVNHATHIMELRNELERQQDGWVKRVR
jgi:DNA replication licensing factor MCM5